MSKKVLIAYASVSGSTGEVAQAIGEVIQGEEALAQVLPTQDVDDIRGFDAIVLGSSIRVGKWLPEAIKFLETFKDIMSRVPVAYFTTCLTMVDNTEESRSTVLAYLEPVLQMAPQIEPVGLGLFAGSLDPNRPSFMQVPGPQGDYRNWDAIKSWAKEVRPALLAGRVIGSETVVMRDAALTGTDLSGADLSRQDLYGADLSQADLVKTDLSEANLKKAGLNWADMNWANMSGANLAKANLIGADLHQANLDHADLSYTILNGSNLSEANLSGANLHHADLNWADLRGANLSDANLGHVNLGWSNLSEANLEGAILRGAKYNSYTEWPQGFSPEAHDTILVGGELH